MMGIDRVRAASALSGGTSRDLNSDCLGTRYGLAKEVIVKARSSPATTPLDAFNRVR